MTSPSLTRTVRRTAAAASRRPKTTIAAWLLLVVALALGGGLAGTIAPDDEDGGVGQSGRADVRLVHAGLKDAPVEHLLVTSADPAATARAVATLRREAGRLPAVNRVGPPERARAGRSALLSVRLRLSADEDDAAGLVGRVVAATHVPGVTVRQAGPGSFDTAISDVVSDDLSQAERLSLPITLAILVLAFGALGAASLPLVLGLSAVVAGIGALELWSHVQPVQDTAFSLVVLIGLAVGVDYSLFAVRRLREEHAAGRSIPDALDVVTATVGRAIVVSGATVVIAVAGLLGVGLPVFTSIAAGMIGVVALAVLGSLTVLPALLTLFGHRVVRRPPWQRERTGEGWGKVARAVTRRPGVALTTAVCGLGCLVVVATQIQTMPEGTDAIPADLPVARAQAAIARDFPAGGPSPAVVVVHGRALDPAGLERVGAAAGAITGAGGAAEVAVSRDATTASLTVGLPDGDAGRAAVVRLRDDLGKTAARDLPGASVQVTGDVARDGDFRDRLAVATPIVAGGVLVLAFALLVLAFGSPWLAAGVIGLNLLSVGAAYGVMVGVFQHTWAEGLLGFTSAGALVDWLPLLSFVILFGISMDYTVLVLERVREARREGLDAREAAAAGIARTASAVTSAALVMVAVFAILGAQSLLSMKQMGVGLAAAVLLDATIVRAIALPALLALLGERRWPAWQTAPRGRRLAAEGA